MQKFALENMVIGSSIGQLLTKQMHSLLLVMMLVYGHLNDALIHLASRAIVVLGTPQWNHTLLVIMFCYPMQKL